MVLERIRTTDRARQSIADKKSAWLTFAQKLCQLKKKYRIKNNNSIGVFLILIESSRARASPAVERLESRGPGVLAKSIG